MIRRQLLHSKRFIFFFCATLLCTACTEKKDEELEEYDQMVNKEEDNSEWIIPPDRTLIGGENGPIAPEVILDESLEGKLR